MRRKVMIATVAAWTILNGTGAAILMFRNAPAYNPADYETFPSIRFLALVVPQLLFTVPALGAILLVEHTLLARKPDQRSIP